jgi:alanyl-tRNA synthetase
VSSKKVKLRDRQSYRDAGTGTFVLNGHVAFHIMDSCGFPFDLLRLELRARQAAFNVQEFVDAAVASKNYKPRTLYKLLTYEQSLGKDEELGIALYIKQVTGTEPRDDGA